MSNDTDFTHLALQVRDIEKSMDFYQRYAWMQVIHQREAGIPEAQKVAWLSGLTRPFALAAGASEDMPLCPFGHIGVACASPEED